MLSFKQRKVFDIIQESLSLGHCVGTSFNAVITFFLNSQYLNMQLNCSNGSDLLFLKTKNLFFNVAPIFAHALSIRWRLGLYTFCTGCYC